MSLLHNSQILRLNERRFIQLLEMQRFFAFRSARSPWDALKEGDRIFVESPNKTYPSWNYRISAEVSNLMYFESVKALLLNKGYESICPRAQSFEGALLALKMQGVPPSSPMTAFFVYPVISEWTQILRPSSLEEKALVE